MLINHIQTFISKLVSCVDIHAPIKRLNKKEVKLKSKRWITTYICKLIDQRNKLFNRRKRQPNNEDIKILYNKFRNRINKEIKNSKKKYFNNFFEENKNNIKKTWIGIKTIINTKTSITIKTSQLHFNGKVIEIPMDISNTFNNFFVNVGPNTESEIRKVNITPESFLKSRNQFNFLITFFSVEELTTIINALDSKNSSGPSSIPTKLLVMITVIFPLCKIINTSFRTGIFPDALKIAKVIPVFRNGSTQELNNYRSISLLSVFDKIIEKLMYSMLYNFLEQHEILYSRQFGFRKQKSTAYSLSDITEKIKASIDDEKYGCGIFIDLKKTFDTVNHSILLRKLEHYGIRGPALDWFKSYLTNCKQYVYFNGHSSETKNITCGVPQGSVLGPLLFLLYINDISNGSKKLDFFLFADDTNIYYESDNLIILEIVVNAELGKLHKWLCALNVKKTNFLIFHPYNKPIKEVVTLKINKIAIAEEQFVKYLGVVS